MHVADDEIGVFPAGGNEPFLTVGCFDDSVTEVGDKFSHDHADDESILDYEHFLVFPLTGSWPFSALAVNRAPQQLQWLAELLPWPRNCASQRPHW
jgi:hypothetical protein